METGCLYLEAADRLYLFLLPFSIRKGDVNKTLYLKRVREPDFLGRLEIERWFSKKMWFICSNDEYIHRAASFCNALNVSCQNITYPYNPM